MSKKNQDFESPLFASMDDAAVVRSMQAAQIIAKTPMSIAITFEGDSARLNISGPAEAEEILREGYTAEDLMRAVILLLATSDGDAVETSSEPEPEPFDAFFDTDGAELKTYWNGEDFES